MKLSSNLLLARNELALSVTTRHVTGTERQEGMDHGSTKKKGGHGPASFMYPELKKQLWLCQTRPAGGHGQIAGAGNEIDRFGDLRIVFGQYLHSGDSPVCRGR